MKDKNTINVTFNSRGYLATRNDDYDLRFKKSGKVDLSFAPDGLSFSPYPVDSMTVARRMHLDPRFIMKHKVSRTTLLCFFLLEESTRSEQTIKDLKKEISYNECRTKDTSVFSELSSADDDGESIDFDPPGSMILKQRLWIILSRKTSWISCTRWI